jgi:hypothetical protein
MCFANSEPKQAQIARAVKILLEALDKPENPALMKRWAQLLLPFRGDQLAEAFTVVALTSKGWPTLGDITEPILDREYSDDLCWLLRNLDRHGVEWQDRPAVYGERWRKPGAKMDDWEPGELKHMAVPAPSIPPRLVDALTAVAGGLVADGLAFLNRHPGTHNVQLPSDEAARAKFQIEKDFKAAWMIARRRELGGLR